VLRSFARRIDPSDAGAHNNLGVLYYNKGLHEEAVSAFRSALELDPKMDVAQRNLEIAYFDTGYYDTRIPQLKDRLNLHPDDREARWELGRTFSLLGQQTDAVEQFRALLQYSPEDVGGLLQLALAEQQAGDIDSAQTHLERALALDPDSALLHVTLGELLHRRGLSSEALQSLERAVALNPENHDALYLLGFVLVDVGRHEEASAATRRAIQLNPSLSRAQVNLALETQRFVPPEPDAALKRELQVSGEGQLARYNLGLALRSKGNYAGALREYQTALECGEERDLVIQAMAEVNLLMRRPVEAVALYDDLLQRQPQSPRLWNERGVALHQKGRFAEAEQSYRRALAAEATYPIAHNNLGVSLYHGGAVDEARAEFSTALAAQPEFVKARLNLALLLSRGKRYQLALDEFRQVLRTEPEQPVAWNGIGLVLSELRKFAGARNAFARAIQTRPDYAEAHYNMSFTLSNLGDFEGALRQTKRALELDPFYVAQTFELAMDVEYEDPDISIQPDLDAAEPTDSAIADFSFDPRSLDSLFAALVPMGTSTRAMAAVQSPDAASSFATATDFLSKGLYDRASAEISRAMAGGDAHPEGLALLGDVFAKQGLYGEALDRYREALRLEPDLRRAVTGEAWCLVRLGRAHEARPLAQQLLVAHQDDVEVLMLTATACGQSGDPAAALAVLDVARRAAPTRADIQQKIGDIARSLGDNEGAISAYRHALELDQDFAVVRFQLARLLKVKGQLREAEYELVAALDAVPTYAQATLELAALRRLGGRPADALTLLIELVQRDPYHFDALLALGETLSALGQKRDAVHAFARVLRFDPHHAGALFHEGLLLAEQRRYNDAVARWEKVIEVGGSTEYGRRARREIRTVTDLQRILSARSSA
jgi:tetratricopeptide (TPR) repeat protein